MKIALATGDGKMVAQHFGHTPLFVIAEVDENGWQIMETRVNTPACDRGEHSHAQFAAGAALISDCAAVIAAKIGPFAQNGLSAMGITPLEKTGFCEEILDGYARYLARKNSPGRGYRPPGRHPCFDTGGGGEYGRLHLPVSALCNIKCRFCARDINADELRPGVTAGILRPAQAEDAVARALELCPVLAVVGVAGPGDALADGAALETFRLVRGRFPHLALCLSTNGLGLMDRVAELRDVGVRHLTVTVNAADPAVGAKIVSQVTLGGQVYTGPAAARLLLDRQRAGLEAAAAAGMEIKVNTVLIPGVNDRHIEEIARAAAALGAKTHNIMPLIPQGEFADAVAPDCLMLEKARAEAEAHLPVFRRCAHCRADACGIPGVSDFSRELYSGAFEFSCGNACG
ncbi:MAG: radical SAM protein [Gracilibacteraceae bacterium]|jgi:nitrogen fixation protein NifB|nr:radical SAM protein [Gracilibacteraceae bacterium]